MNKIVSRKGIVLIIIPLFVVFIQWFVRYVCKEDFNTIGITFASLGLGQLIPFLHFDHMVANKLLKITSTSTTLNAGKMVIEYELKGGVNMDQAKIEELKNTFMLAIFAALSLFFIVIYLGIQQQIFSHILLGLIICAGSWYLLIFKND